MKHSEVRLCPGVLYIISIITRFDGVGGGYGMTSTPVNIEYTTLITTVPSRMGFPSAVTRSQKTRNLNACCPPLKSPIDIKYS